MKKILAIACMIFLALGASAENKVKPSLQNVFSYGFVNPEGTKLKAIVLEYNQDYWCPVNNSFEYSIALYLTEKHKKKL